MKKSELKEMIKSAFMAEGNYDEVEAAQKRAGDTTNSKFHKDLDKYKTSSNYGSTRVGEGEEDLDELLARLSEEEIVAEAEEEVDVDVDVDAEEETTDGGEEEKASDSIVIDKKIVSLSSLPGETRKILDTLETLRAQAEEFGDQKFITQVGNTITFFTRDFVVAGDAPNPAGIEESDTEDEKLTKAEAELTLESLRMQKLAGIITEGSFKKKVDEISKGVTSPQQIDSADELAKKIDAFFNTPEAQNILNKFNSSLQTTQKDTLNKLVKENDLSDPSFVSFFKDNLRNWAKQIKTQNEDINEGALELADDIAYGVADFMRKFAKVNIMGMGMLPVLTSAAVEYFGGPEVLSKAVELVGDPLAATGASVIATLIGSALVWKLVDKATGEETSI